MRDGNFPSLKRYQMGYRVFELPMRDGNVVTK